MNEGRAYDLVIFDCDGTLVDSEAVTSGLLQEMMADLGIDIDQYGGMHQFTGGQMSMITDFLELRLDAFDADGFVTDYRAECANRFRTDLKPVSGVVDILRQLKVKMCIGSNAPQSKMEVSLSVTGLYDFFDRKDVHSAYDIEVWKPDGRFYAYVAEQYGVSPDRAIVIEDSYAGMMGAVNAGIDVIVYDPHGDDNLIHDKSTKCDTMSQISARLESFGLY